MCGIAGVFSLNEKRVSEDLLSRMVSILKHRGPDESGLYLDETIGLGHSRLSVIGLDDGTQPLCNEDGSLWIVYNGEIFNYLELKEDLTKMGHRFSTHTDTEVILHLYEEFGPSCLERMNGQFALAIWASTKKELFLARDRVGIRPLYFVQTRDKFVFASEIKAIFLDPEIRRELDPEALHQVFTFWTTITPKTAFKDVHELAPGHSLTINQGGQAVQKAYWRIPCYSRDEQWTGSFDEAKEELRALLLDAVRLRLRADVPVGAYLSGGLDSSILTSLISRNFNNQLRTFSLAFQESAFDESPYQRELVAFLGTDHSQIAVTNAQIREHFAETIWHCERPLVRTGPVPLFLLSRLVKENRFKVALTGEGADEVFGGYNIFKEAKLRRFWARQPQSRWRPLLLERLYPYILKNPSRSRYFLQQFFGVEGVDMADPFFSHRIRWEGCGKNTAFFSAPLQEGLMGYLPFESLSARLPRGFGSYDGLAKAQFLEMDVFLSNYLLSSQGDRVGMANSLELRLPFLDYRVIDFAARLPPRWKIRGMNEKYILKQTFQDDIPANITQRTKQPYRAPIREAFFQDNPDGYVYDLLGEDYLKKTGYFNEKKVGHLVAKYQKINPAAANETQNMALVGILSTQLLHHQFVENFSGAAIAPVRPDKIVRKAGNRTEYSTHGHSKAMDFI